MAKKHKTAEVWTEKIMENYKEPLNVERGLVGIGYEIWKTATKKQNGLDCMTTLEYSLRLYRGMDYEET